MQAASMKTWVMAPGHVGRCLPGWWPRQRCPEQGSSQEAIYTLLRTPGQELVFQTWEGIGTSCDLGRKQENDGETCLEKKKPPEKAQIMSGRGGRKEQYY